MNDIFELRDLLLKEDYIEIGLELSSLGHYEVMATLDDIPLVFILDTGAANTVLDLTYAQEKNISTATTEHFGGGVGNAQMAIHSIQSHKLVIGAFSIDEPVLFAMDFQHVRQALLEKGIAEPSHGVLGADILIAYHAVIDYAHHKLYLKSKPDPERLPYYQEFME